jgi:AcrR family transcriptional regulator
LNAAREEFDANGFAATTTKDIADRAGVRENLLFTNFGSKVALFDAAVVDPFSNIINDYVLSWERRSGSSSPEERIAALIDGLYDLVKQHRRLFATALAQRLDGGRSEDDDLLDRLGQRLHHLLDIDALGSDYPDMDVVAAMGAFAGSVIGAALLDDLLYPRGTRTPSRARLKLELSRTLLDGYRGRRLPRAQ